MLVLGEFLASLSCSTRLGMFYLEKLAEAFRRFGELKHQFGLDDPVHFDVIEVASEANQAFENEETKDKNENRGDKKPRKPLKYTVSNKKLKEMKFAVSEFYLSLVLIQNFQVTIYVPTFYFVNFSV